MWLTSVKYLHGRSCQMATELCEQPTAYALAVALGIRLYIGYHFVLFNNIFKIMMSADGRTGATLVARGLPLRNKPKSSKKKTIFIN